jgi:hypothetical protein
MEAGLSGEVQSGLSLAPYAFLSIDVSGDRVEQAFRDCAKADETLASAAEIKP